MGYSQNGTTGGFSRHPDGFLTPVIVPAPLGQRVRDSLTVPDGINAEGAIAGWYSMQLSDSDCGSGTLIQCGFVLSPDGVYTLFNPPGTLVTSSLPPVFVYDQQSLTVPHWVSIDQAGDIAGSYTDTNGVQHGFVRNPYGTITSFDPPEGNHTTSTGINDGGAITGFYQYSAGSAPPVGFIRVPLV